MPTVEATVREPKGLLAEHTGLGASQRSAPSLDIAVPVYNEEEDLVPNIRRLRDYLDSRFPFRAVITVVDNGSTDTTWDVAKRLSDEVPGVRALHLDAKGRGRALKVAWLASEADVVAYMDVDLSTDLDALLPLVAPLTSGHSDLAIGSRLAQGARVLRGPRREVISRGYNLLLRVFLGAHFTDAQCGFKALRARDARLLLPRVADDEWFFDTELLVLAERGGLRIHEVPVDWADDPDSRVKVAKTAMADLKGMWRLLRDRPMMPRAAKQPARQGRPLALSDPEGTRFARVGIASTIAYLVLFVALRGTLGAYLANITSLVALALLNTMAQLRYAFAWRPLRPRSVALVASATLATSLAVTTASLVVSNEVAPRSLVGQLVALLAGNALAAFARFLTMQALVFRTYLRH